MNNGNLLYLINGGILNITANDLDASQAYKVLKIKKAIKKAFAELGEAEQALLAEVGIDNPSEFDKRFAELTKRERTQEESLELTEMNVKRSRLLDMRKPLYDEEVDLGDIKTMPYEAWHTLQAENKASKVLNGIGEELLENILWIMD